MAAMPGGGGPPAGVDTAQLAAMQQGAQAAQQGGKTGLHQLLFGIGSPKHNIGPDVQKAYWEGLIPGFKTSPFFKPGGGLNSRAKPIDMKKSGYQPPPGGSPNPPGEGAIPQTYQGAVHQSFHGAGTNVMSGQGQGALAGVQHGGESKSNAGAMQAAMAANTTQNALAAAQSQTQHLKQLGIGGEQSMPFAPMDPMIQMKTAFMTMMYNRMSPLGMPNFSPVLGVFANGGSMGGGGTAALQHQAAMAAQVAAMASASRVR